MLGKIFGGVIGSVISSLIGKLFGLFADRQQRADQIELGEKRQETAQREAAAKVEKRMQEAAAEPRDADTTQGRLKDGSF